MRQVLLDTNSYSGLFRGDRLVKQETDASKEVLMSVITIGELYAGFKKGNQEAKNQQILGRFIKNSKVRVVNIGLKTAQIYGNVKAALAEKGTPIPDNDIWIAAASLETKSTLITFDRHFLKVPGLKLWKELKL